MILLAVLILSPDAWAQPRFAFRDAPNTNPRCPVRPQDEIWMISTRHLPFDSGACHCPVPELDYLRYEDRRGWARSSADTFFQGQTNEAVTTVYVHGNRVTYDWSLDQGFATYGRLIDCNRCREKSSQPGPIRHVIWSWPSQPVGRKARIINDARIKAIRTAPNAYYLAWWLAQLNADQRTSLLGFSYGGRTIFGALHLLNGGKLCDCPLTTNDTAKRIRPRVAIWACASETDWLCPGGCYSQSIAQVERGLLIYNRHDPILRRYQRLIPGAQSPALGITKLPCGADPEGRFCEIDASSTIGKVHRFKPYMESSRLVGRIRHHVLWQDADPTESTSVATNETQPIDLPIVPSIDRIAPESVPAEPDHVANLPNPLKAQD